MNSKSFSSPDEVFDVVNDKDEVVGQEIRREVHRLGLKHRAVHVLVFNERGEVFLQKRSMTKDSQPGKWDSSASGHLDAGEDYDASAVREVHEELGWRCNVTPRRLFKVDACQETGQEFVWVYHMEAEGPFVLHPEEIDEGGWFERHRLRHLMEEKPEEFANCFRLIWAKAQAKLPS